jgi:Ca2+-binding EF-hand superfamily protein
LLLLAGTWAVLPQQPTARPAPETSDVEDIVFLADERPVLVRLHVRVDGQPLRKAYQDAWTDYVKHLFRYLDRDGDGFLSEVEARRLPAARPLLAPAGGASMPVNVAFNFRVVDADGDGKISLEELLEYYRQYSGPALQASVAPTRFDITPQLGDALFALLDTNKDGKLARAELEAAPELMKLDSDDDELLSPQELAPQLYARSELERFNLNLPGQRRAQAAPTPFMVLSAGDLRGRSDRRIQDKYAKPVLEKFADALPDLELVFRLGNRADDEKQVEVLARNEQGLTPSVSSRETEVGLILTIGKTLIEFRANDGRPAISADLRQRYLQQFRSADAAGKRFLTLRDAELRGFFPAQFELLDRDGDGKLTEKELLAYLDEVQQRQAKALTNTTVLLVSTEGRTLFDLLDRNRDGRLSRRELHAAAGLLARLGLKPNGTISPDDLPRTYILSVGLGGAGFDRFGGRGTFSPSGIPLLELDWTPPGLSWFFAMDRNHDGEVSWREFLGRREDFRRLDTDGDGVISIEEALKARKLPER